MAKGGFMEFPIFRDMLLEQMNAKSAKKRKIIFNDEVDRDSASKVIYWLNLLEELDEMRGTKEPITIVIDSYGGVIHAGLGLIGEMERLKDKGYKIITDVRSVAMSMGFAIALCGSERISTRYARFMSHQPSSASWGKMQDMKEDLAETEKLWEIMKGIIMKNSNITEEALEESRMRKTDVYYTPEELMALGGLDRIV